MTNVPCPVCHVAAHRPCVAVDYRTLPGPHVERTETTPIGDQIANDHGARGAA